MKEKKTKIEVRAGQKRFLPFNTYTREVGWGGKCCQPKTSHCVEPLFVSKKCFKQWHCVGRARPLFAFSLPEDAAESLCLAFSPGPDADGRLILHTPEQM